MSLGWLTESALIPNKPKEIQVSKSSLSSLQAIVFEKDREKKERIAATNSTVRRPTKLPKSYKEQLMEVKNDGIEARRRRDDESKVPSEEASYAESFSKLQQKARQYEAMSRGEVIDDIDGQAFGGGKKHPRLNVNFKKKRSFEEISEWDDDDEGSLVDFEAKRFQGNATPSVSSVAPAAESAQKTMVSADMRLDMERRSWEEATEAEIAASEGVQEVEARAKDTYLQGGVRQNFERKLLSADDRQHVDALHAETQRNRAAAEATPARDAMRSRLQRLREAKAKQAATMGQVSDDAILRMIEEAERAAMASRESPSSV